MKCIWEHNGNDTLLYYAEYIGAYSRGKNLDAALAKMKAEIESYTAWSGQIAKEMTDIEIIQETNSTLQIADADSDILFDSEKAPLTIEEYKELKALVLKS